MIPRISLNSLKGVKTKYGNTRVVIDYNYAIDNNLIAAKNKDDARAVLGKYCKMVQDKLLKDGSYCIMNEKSTGKKIKLVRLMIKQVNKRTEGYYKRVSKLKGIKDGISETTLKLSVDMQGGKMNGRKIVVMSSGSFKSKLAKIPLSERYKYPKE